MPRGDQTGPRGTGPASGRGLGFCTGASTPGYRHLLGRGGNGLGRGLGRKLWARGVFPGCVYLGYCWAKGKQHVWKGRRDS